LKEHEADDWSLTLVLDPITPWWRRLLWALWPARDGGMYAEIMLRDDAMNWKFLRKGMTKAHRARTPPQSIFPGYMFILPNRRRGNKPGRGRSDCCDPPGRR
jgi:hypothetical protein